MKLFNEEYPCIQISKRILIYGLVAYVAISLLIFFNAPPWLKNIANEASRFMPGMKGTAKITDNPEVVLVILILAWLWGVMLYAPFAFCMFSKPTETINWPHLESLSTTMKVGGSTLILLGIYPLAIAAPVAEHGGVVNNVLYGLLASSPHWGIAWGYIFCVYICFSLVFTHCVLTSLVYNKKLRR